MSAQTEKTKVEGQKPNKKDKYKTNGFPRPNNSAEITIDMLKTARDMSKNCSDIMVKYIRDYKIEKVLNDKGHVISNRVVRGQPFAAMIAFKNTDGKVIIGWSKRHPGRIFKGGRHIDIEPLPFSKKDAIAVAILRAMTDTLTIKAGSPTIRTKDGKFIPKIIERVLPGFIQRARSYFQTDAVNVIQ